MLDMSYIFESGDLENYDLKARYNELNKLYFDGRLPDIPIKWSILKNVGGHVTYSYITPAGWVPPHPLKVKMGVADRLEGCILVPGSIKMVISKLFKRSNEALDQILMHEMIHVLHAVTGKLGEGHGPRFLLDRRYYSQKSGIDIPLKDNVEGLEKIELPVKKLGVVLVKLPQDKFAYAIVSAKFIENAYNKFANNPDDLELTFSNYSASIWIIETPKWTDKSFKSTIQRKYDTKTKLFMLLDKDLLSDLVNNGKRLAGSNPIKSGNDMRDFINIVEGEVIPFPNKKMQKAVNSLKTFMADTRPIEKKYDIGDVLIHRSSKEIVEVVDKEDSPIDPILTVKIRSNNSTGHFFASEFDPASVEHWKP